MTSEPLKTYLRTYRLRSCLSQDEVAFLLGSMCGRSVGRHEKGDRLPALMNLLGYAFILEVDVPTLYEGLAEEVRARVRKRARGLHAELLRQPQSARRDKKLLLLKRLLEEDTKRPFSERQ